MANDRLLLSDGSNLLLSNSTDVLLLSTEGVDPGDTDPTPYRRSYVIDNRREYEAVR